MSGATSATRRPGTADPQALAARFGVSLRAAELLADSEVIDLHIDTFIPPRLPLIRYDLQKRHDKVFLGGRFFGHLDLPRILSGGLTGAMWSITTNPFRFKGSRWALFQKNFARYRALFDTTPGFSIATTAAEYRAARSAGDHVVLPAIQGGNALEASPEGLASAASLPGGRGPSGHPTITRVTLVHLTNTSYGITSSPFKLWKGKRGLTDLGRGFIADLNRHRVFVDLAHINAAGFWDAVAVHDTTQPLIATHTGVAGVKPHWRNLDDRQVRAIADTGGVIGLIYAKNFLARRGGPHDVGMVVEHMEHVMKVAGEDAVSLGTDYDGAIIPPADVRSGDSYVRLVQKLLDRGHTELTVRKVLGLNFLRSFERLRP